MKKYILIGGLCLSMFLVACDNYLDLVPKGESILSTTEDYLGLIEERDPSYPLDGFWYLTGDATWPYKTEIESYKYPIRSIAFLWDEEKDRYQYTESDLLYNNCYKRISNYNVVIANMKDADGPDADKRLGVAQAKIMRAYNYFFLVNTFAKPYKKETAATDGGVIIHEKLDLEAVGKQYTVAQVYDFIQQDIEEALPDLPEKALNSLRPGKNFGYGLKAKVHLYKGEIDLALEAGLKALKSGYHKLWDMNEMYESVRAAHPDVVFNPSGFYYYANFSMSDPEHLLYQYASAASDPNPFWMRKEVVDLYDKSSDLRYLTCLMYGTPTRPTAEKGAVMFGATKMNWNCGGMRLSDVYLIVAECYARRGDADNAMKYLNDLRQKRVVTALYKSLTAASSEEAFKLIRDERKREFVFTYNTFFDMRRFSAEFNETLTREYMTTGDETLSLTLKPDSPLFVWPFPQNAMETSNLVQNTK